MLLATSWNPGRSPLRQFAWGLGLLLALGSLRMPQGSAALGLRLAAGIVFAVGTLWPSWFQAPYSIVLVVTYPVRWVISHVLLGMVFYALLTPLALAFRLLGRDALERSFEPEATTYWQPRASVRDMQGYCRQF